MRLYTNKRGDWAGTQADARKLDGKYIEVDVPVSKADLLAFLNQNSVGSMAVESKPQPTTAPSEPRNLKGGSWDEYNAIRDHLETCDAKALNTALTIITGRLGDLLEDAN